MTVGWPLYSFARSRLITSSEVITPVNLLLIVYHGQSEQVVLVEQFRNFFLGGIGMAGDQGLLGEREQWRFR